jgi:hypothetical protein
MSKVLGEAGRYVSQQSIKKYQKQFIAIFLITCVFAFGVGCLVGARPKGLFSYALLVLLLITFILAHKKLDRDVASLERERLQFRKGAVGEAVVAHVLDNFPDDYYVINDITTDFGNIDHVVVGPSGAYIIDTKNWKGVVEADGSGEFLLNGRPTSKPEVKNLIRRIMSIKSKIEVLSPLKDPFIRGLLVFPSAHVKATWGSTGHVHCLTDEQLYDYIVENIRGKKLTAKEVDAFSQSFLALARMDKDFA